jgi:AraC-like DNA-binding protein
MALRPNAPALESPQVRIVARVGVDLQAYARSRGLNLAPLAEALDLTLEDFNSYWATINLDKFSRLLEALATLSGDDCFGLGYAAYVKPGTTGALSYGYMSAPTLRHSMQFFVKYNPIVIDLAHQDLVLTHEKGIYEWALPSTLLETDQINDMVAAATIRNFSAFVGKGWLTRDASLQRQPPRSLLLHRSMVANVLRFGASVNSIGFDTRMLDEPNPRHDPNLHALMDAECSRLLALKREKPLTERIRDHIAKRLDREDVSLASIARQIGSSERTLQRDLAAMGTSFAALLEDVRKENALRYLTNTSLTLAEIAYKLGFSAPSAFTRSAIRWFGKTPSQVRKTQKPTEF